MKLKWKTDKWLRSSQADFSVVLAVQSSPKLIWKRSVLVWQRITGLRIRVGKRFALNSDAHVGFLPSNKPPEHANITDGTAGETWSFHIIVQSARTKDFPASFIVSKYITEKRLSHVFYCMERNSSFGLLFWQTKACPSSGRQTFNEMASVTEHHLEDCIQRKTKIHLAKSHGIVLKFLSFVHTEARKSDSESYW